MTFMLSFKPASSELLLCSFSFRKQLPILDCCMEVELLKKINWSQLSQFEIRSTEVRSRYRKPKGHIFTYFACQSISNSWRGERWHPIKSLFLCDVSLRRQLERERTSLEFCHNNLFHTILMRIFTRIRINQTGQPTRLTRISHQ